MATIVGQGAFRYAVDKNWGRGPAGVPSFGLISGVACDSEDRVYVFHRSPDPRVMVFGRDGNFLRSWGEGAFQHPHGIFITLRDEVYLTDRDAHQVTKWTTRGTPIRRWGTNGQAGAPGQPFNQPTHAVEASDGDMYVSDGYGQFRVHRFDPSGYLVHSWGEEGTGPSQFALPHDVWVDSRNRVLVCDRENARVQLFDRSGQYLGEWAGRKNPMQIVERDEILYVAEALQQVSIMDLEGRILSTWGSHGERDDQFTDAPHAIWVDSRGDIYVTEVVAANKIQKFIRQ